VFVDVHGWNGTGVYDGRPDGHDGDHITSPPGSSRSTECDNDDPGVVDDNSIWNELPTTHPREGYRVTGLDMSMGHSPFQSPASSTSAHCPTMPHPESMMITPPPASLSPDELSPSATPSEGFTTIIHCHTSTESSIGAHTITISPPPVLNVMHCSFRTFRQWRFDCKRGSCPQKSETKIQAKQGNEKGNRGRGCLRNTSCGEY